jgi:hypothetical protein
MTIERNIAIAPDILVDNGINEVPPIVVSGDMPPQACVFTAIY